MERNDIRWIQRFENFEKAWLLLSESAVKSSYTKLEKGGLVQFFEFTFELSWKTMKDYMEGEGVDAKFPRQVIKEAFHKHIITNGDVWMDMLDKRNLMTHTYDETKADQAVELIKTYYVPAIAEVYQYFKSIF